MAIFGTNWFKVTNNAFKKAAVLCKLLETDENSQDDRRFLVDKGLYWIRSETPERVLVGLNVLRFLIKAGYLDHNKKLLDEILEIFFSGGSLPSSTIAARPAIRLAALDLLANMSVTPNPVSKLPPEQAKELVQFRAQLMKSSNKDKDHREIDAKIERESRRVSCGDAIRSIASSV